MFVKPNNGLRVRDPVKGSPLPESGAEVPDNTFWRRRLRDGDVVTAEKPAVVQTHSQAEEKGDTE